MANKSTFIYQLKNYNSKLAELKKKLSVLEKSGDINEMSSTINKIAYIYYYQGYLDQCIKYMKLINEIYEESENYESLAQCYNFTGAVYSDYGKFDMAETFFVKSVNYAQNLKEKPKYIIDLLKCKLHLNSLKLLDPILSEFPSPPYDNQELSTLHHILNAIVAESQHFNSVAELGWEFGSKTTANDLFTKIKCHQSIVRLAFHRFLLNPERESYFGLLNRLMIWRELVIQYKYSPGICRTHLLLSVLTIADFRFNIAIKYLKKSHDRAKKVGLPLHQKLSLIYIKRVESINFDDFKKSNPELKSQFQQQHFQEFKRLIENFPLQLNQLTKI